MLVLIEDTNIPAQTNWVDGDGAPMAEPADHLFLRRLKTETAPYTPSPGENDVTSPENWGKYQGFVGFDFMWLLFHLDEWMTAETWGTLSNDDKDYMIFYNRHRGAVGDGDKVTHMIVSAYTSTITGIDYSTVTTPAEAVPHLETIHAQNTERAKPAARLRGDSEVLFNLIISYLDATDTDSLLNTIRVDLSDFLNYVRIGTAVPGETSGLRDYIESTGDYVGAGLVETGYIVKATAPAPATLEGLRDKLVDLLFENGIT